MKNQPRLATRTQAVFSFLLIGSGFWKGYANPAQELVMPLRNGSAGEAASSMTVSDCCLGGRRSELHAARASNKNFSLHFLSEQLAITHPWRLATPKSLGIAAICPFLH